MKLSLNTLMWWPDFESGMEDVEPYMIRRVTDVEVAMKHVRTRGIAVQAGGHVGMWARQLSKHFAFVHTYEPVADMFTCLKRNVELYPNIIPHQAALGPMGGSTCMAVQRGGRSKVARAGEVANVCTIDSIGLARCDLIYLDIEGFEIEALKGAEATIEQFKPVVVLECLKGRAAEQTDWANRMKYTVAARIHNDVIFVP